MNYNIYKSSSSFYLVKKEASQIDEASRGVKMAGQPEKRFTSGLVKAAVWKNKSKTGGEFRTVSLNRSYRKNGEWKNTNSFSADDLDKAIEVLKQAKEYLTGNCADEEVIS